MADQKYTGLGDGAPAQSADVLAIERSSTSFRLTLANLSTLFASTLSSVYAALVHGHAQSEITGLTTDLAGKASAVHNHAQVDVVNLVTDLAGKASTTHAVTHKSGGSDPIKLDELAAPTDITALNASTSAHGLMQKYPGGSTNFLREDGVFTAPAGGGNVSNSGTPTNGQLAQWISSTGIQGISATALTALLDLFTSGLKGLVPASGGGTSNFLRADGSWSTPAGGGNVSNSGTPVANQLAQWVNATTVQGISATSLTALLDLFSSTLKGLVPASGGGTSNFLRADGSWVAPPGGGSTPTGTGFRHITSGVEDGASVAVNLATADVTGDLPASSLFQASAASRIMLRGSGAGGGDWQEGTIGSNLSIVGTVLDAVGGSGGVEVLMPVISDVVHATASTTLSDVTGIVLTTTASPTERWFLNIFLLTNANAAAATGARWKFGWTTSGGQTVEWWGPLEEAVVVGSAQPTRGNKATTLAYGSAAVNGAIRLQAVVFSNGVAGDVKLQFAQNVATAGAILTIQAGSGGIAKRMRA